MNVIGYSPWSLLDRLHRDVDRMFSAHLRADPDRDAAGLGHWLPAVDVEEENERFVIRADLPGVAPGDVELTMEDGHVIIEGHRDTQADAGQEGWRRVERVSGRFHRRVALPDTADAEGIEAEYSNGVLEIAVPKQAKSLPRRIQVKAS